MYFFPPIVGHPRDPADMVSSEGCSKLLEDYINSTRAMSESREEVKIFIELRPASAGRREITTIRGVLHTEHLQ